MRIGLLSPHVVHALFLPHPPDEDKAIEVELLRKVGSCLETNRQYKKASDVANREVNLRKELLGESYPKHSGDHEQLRVTLE